jgi:TfoX/Sxy family transcriptional regulator of competence genes
MQESSAAFARDDDSTFARRTRVNAIRRRGALTAARHTAAALPTQTARVTTRNTSSSLAIVTVRGLHCAAEVTMAWQKIPKEHHPLLYAALPDDDRAETIVMFGGVAVKVNGHMAGGLWADTVVVRVGEKDRAAVLAMKGGAPFDPMGRGNPMKDMVLLPAPILHERSTLRRWLKKAIDFTATLPPKSKTPKAGAKKAGAAKPKKAAAKKKTAPKKKATRR